MNKYEIVETAIKIAEEYRAMTLTLTLRQLYYQFVARAYIANGQKQYKRLGAILTEARYNGSFPVAYIEDRGRTVHSGDFKDDKTNVNAALKEAARYVRSIPNWVIDRARWIGQDAHVSVWVEKEALSGVFETVCNDLGVSWFACKGYPSVSSLYAWLKQVQRFPATEAVVLYFGDHDPDGWQIPRSALEGINTLQAVDALNWGEETGRAPMAYPKHKYIRFKRCALNMDQIDHYDPPPFPAKSTSARYKKYLIEHRTQDAWELDALEPSVLQDLIRDRVEEHFDEEIHDQNEELIAKKRKELIEKMADGDWLQDALNA